MKQCKALRLDRSPLWSAIQAGLKIYRNQSACDPEVKTKLREAAKAVKYHIDGTNFEMRRMLHFFLVSFLTVTSIFLFLLTCVLVFAF